MRLQSRRGFKLGTHHATFVGTTIVVCGDDGQRSSIDPHTPCMRRSSNDRTHCATEVGCTHDGRQQLKQIANLADIFLYQEEEEETLFNNITLIIGPT